MSSIFTTEVRLDTRISSGNVLSQGVFRYTVSSVYRSYGKLQLPEYRVFNSDYEYHKLSLNLQQWFNFGTIGWSKYILESGRSGKTALSPAQDTWRQPDFPVWRVCVKPDELLWVCKWRLCQRLLHPSFRRIFLQQIPLFRKLKWREVVFVKGVYGHCLIKIKLFPIPDNLRSFAKKPYWEAGAGIENILKIFRVDAIWRMSHLHDNKNPNASKFGVFLSLNFSSDLG